MNKFLILTLLSIFLASSMAGNFRNLGKKNPSSATAVVTVTPVAAENVAVNVPEDLGTTTTTKVYCLPDGTVIKKEIIAVHKTYLNGIVTCKTTTTTITYNNNGNAEQNTEVEVTQEAEENLETVTVVGDSGENVVVVVNEGESEAQVEEEGELETTTTTVTEPQTGGEVKDLGTTVTTKVYRTEDGTFIKKVIITVHKTCENGIITTQTICKTITYTPKAPVVSNGGSGENVIVVVPEEENQVEEECDTVKTTVIEAETPTVGENVVVTIEEQEENVEEVPQDLGKTVSTKIYRLSDGTICKKEIITVQKTCLNGVLTTTTTTKAITWNY